MLISRALIIFPHLCFLWVQTPCSQLPSAPFWELLCPFQAMGSMPELQTPGGIGQIAWTGPQSEFIPIMEWPAQLTEHCCGSMRCFNALSWQLQVAANTHTNVPFLLTFLQFLSIHLVWVMLVPGSEVHDHTFFFIECHAPSGGPGWQLV